MSAFMLGLESSKALAEVLINFHLFILAFIRSVGIATLGITGRSCSIATWLDCIKEFGVWIRSICVGYGWVWVGSRHRLGCWIPVVALLSGLAQVTIGVQEVNELRSDSSDRLEICLAFTLAVCDHSSDKDCI
jgi:hypothetical protein